MKHRPSARILIINPLNEVLLFNFTFDVGPLRGHDFWATPGGGLENDETYHQTAHRELLEETGITIDVGNQVAQRDAVFKTPSGETVIADERYYQIRVFNNSIDNSMHSELERQHMVQHKWWPVDDLKTTHETIFPEKLISILKELTDIDR